MAPSDETDAQDLAHWDPDPRQLDMFGPPPARDDDPDPERVRAELLGLLARARAAPDVPWDPGEVALYRTVFPQMANRLPVEEAALLRLEFAAELARLEACRSAAA